MYRTITALAFGVASVVSLSSAASAADLPAKSLAPIYKAGPVAEGWTVSLGAEGRYMPSFPGADRYEVNPFPIVEIRRTGTPRRFTSPKDNFGFTLFDWNGFAIGPVGKLIYDRRERDYSQLRGLGDVDFTVELGGFVEYYAVPWLRTRAEVRNGIGGHDGLVADLSADAIARVSPQLTLSAGPRVTFASDNALSPYFSVSPTQSLLSGLPVYNVKGGLYSYGIGGQARYEWTPKIETHVFVEYERLTDSTSRAPLVVFRGSRDQVTIGFGASYAFDIPALIPGLF
jgi:outer membrane protein